MVTKGIPLIWGRFLSTLQFYFLNFLLFSYFTESIKFNTTEKCGGQVQVNYRNKWEPVCLLKFPDKFKEKLCQDLDCNGFNDSYDSKVILPYKYWETAMNCTEEHNDIKHCVTQRDVACSLQQQKIYCNSKLKTPLPKY